MKEFTLGKPQGSKPHRSRETIFLYHKDGTPFDLESLSVPGGVLDLSALDSDQVIGWEPVVDGPTDPRIQLDDWGYPVVFPSLGFGPTMDDYNSGDHWGLFDPDYAALIYDYSVDPPTGFILRKNGRADFNNPHGTVILNPGDQSGYGHVMFQDNPEPTGVDWVSFKGVPGDGWRIVHGSGNDGSLAFSDNLAAEVARFTPRVGGGLDFTGGPLYFASADPSDVYAGVTVEWDDDEYGLVFRGRHDEGTDLYVYDTDGTGDAHVNLNALDDQASIAANGIDSGQVTAGASSHGSASMVANAGGVRIVAQNALGGSVTIDAGADFPFYVVDPISDLTFAVDSNGPRVYKAIEFWKAGTGTRGTLAISDTVQGIHFNKGIGQWGHEPPAGQPVTPSDLPGVIALLQSYGLCS